MILDLPPELRFLIYEYIIADLHSQDGFTRVAEGAHEHKSVRDQVFIRSRPRIVLACKTCSTGHVSRMGGVCRSQGPATLPSRTMSSCSYIIKRSSGGRPRKLALGGVDILLRFRASDRVDSADLAKYKSGSERPDLRWILIEPIEV